MITEGDLDELIKAYIYKRFIDPARSKSFDMEDVVKDIGVYINADFVKQVVAGYEHKTFEKSESGLGNRVIYSVNAGLTRKNSITYLYLNGSEDIGAFIKARFGAI